MNEFTSEKERELRDEVKGKLIEELNLEEITPEDIDDEAPLFGDEGTRPRFDRRARNHPDSGT